MRSGSLKILLALLFAVSVPIVVQAQTEERFFCGACGKQAELKASYCFDCGRRLEKTALVSRLKQRLVKTDSLEKQVLFTEDEISVLVEHEVESRAKEMMRSGGLTRPSRPKRQMEKTLDFVAPIVAGLAAIYFLSKTLYQTH